MKLIGKAYTKFVSFWQRHMAIQGSSPPLPIKHYVADQFEESKDQILVHEEGHISPNNRIDVAIRKTDSEGQKSSADLYDDGRLVNRISGTPPQGETGSEQVCQILIEALNKQGANWGNPRKVTDKFREEVDCEASDEEKKLEIQIRRVAKQDEYHRLSKNSEVDSQSNVDDAADMLENAISRKGKKYGPTTRKRLVLALDAIEYSIYSLSPVVDSFRRRHGNSVSKLGFKEIWVVGPTANLTRRLDRS